MNRRAESTVGMTTFLASIIVGMLVAGPIAAEDVTAAHDFRSGNFNGELIQFNGADAEQFVKPEKDGLHIRFRPGSVPRDPVGVMWKTRVIGNFVATVRYEILQNEQPKRGSGVGIELYLMLDNAARDGVAFARLINPERGPLTAFNVRTNDDKGRRISKAHESPPTTEATLRGRLRLVREGRIGIASIAEGDDDAFKEIARCDIGGEHLRMVRVAGLPGQDGNAVLDVRILDIQLTGDLPGFDGIDLPKIAKVVVNDAVGNVPAALTETPRVPRWVVVVIVLGGGLLTLLIAAVLFIVLYKKKARSASAGEKTMNAYTGSNAQEPGKITGASPSLTVACSECGKKMKVRESFIGKRVKCPACGHANQVSVTE